MFVIRPSARSQIAGYGAGERFPHMGSAQAAALKRTVLIAVIIIKVLQ